MIDHLSWIERDFQYAPFAQIAHEMKQFVNQRSAEPQLWYGEHCLIVTKGVRAQQTPVQYWPNTESNRGGQLTMHCPGQLVFYPLWNVMEYLTIAQYRWILEETVMQTIEQISQGALSTFRVPECPGVFTERGKIASLGLRLYRKSVYHGMSFNVACPLKPFQTFVSCGNAEMSITTLTALGFFVPMRTIKALMKKYFYQLLIQETAGVTHDSSS